MDPMTASLIGGIAGSAGGGLLGGIGGFFSASDRRDARRSAQRDFLAEMGEFQTQQKEGIREARLFADKRVKALLSDPLISRARNFIGDAFQEGGSSALAENFSKGLRAAQEARGTRRGAASAVAEASGLAAQQQGFLASLLPQAMEFGTLGERFRQSVFSAELPVRIAKFTGAAIPGVSQYDPNLVRTQQRLAAFDGMDPASMSPFTNALTQGVAGSMGGFQAGSGIGSFAAGGGGGDGGFKAMLAKMTQG